MIEAEPVVAPAKARRSVKTYHKANVFDAALKRINRLFDEFPNVIVGYSGGKDSTIAFHLTLQVARERKRLPLNVLWIDQEAEWQATVDVVESVMTHEDVRPYWMQIPMVLSNATSSTESWLRCWHADEEDRWMRPRHPLGMTENRYGTERFHALFNAIIGTEFRGQRTALIGGVRAEESPVRVFAVTRYPTYKDIAWGKILNRREHHYAFYPFYDWSYTDVWKAIYDHGWKYNAIYDAQYRYGIPVHAMRVSNVHHETAVHALFMMQELEPETYERLTQRISGIDAAAKFGADDYFVHELPFMFRSWIEYRDYLLEHLIANPEWRDKMRANYRKFDPVFGASIGDRYYRVCVQGILANDWEGTKLKNYVYSPGAYVASASVTGKAVW